MAKHTHTLRKKIKAVLNQPNRVQQLIEELYEMALKADTPAATKRACIKDLLDFGIMVEKDISLLIKNDKDGPEVDDDDIEDISNVSYIQTKI